MVEASVYPVLAPLPKAKEFFFDAIEFDPIAIVPSPEASEAEPKANELLPTITCVVPEE